MLSLQRMFCRLSNYSAKMTIGQKKEGVAMENEPDFGSGDRKWEEWGCTTRKWSVDKIGRGANWDRRGLGFAADVSSQRLLIVNILHIYPVCLWLVEKVIFVMNWRTKIKPILCWHEEKHEGYPLGAIPSCHLQRVHPCSWYVHIDPSLPVSVCINQCSRVVCHMLITLIILIMTINGQPFSFYTKSII